MSNSILSRWQRLPKQLEIFRLGGIPIQLDYSWFIIFIVYTWAIAGFYLPALAPDLSRWHYWLLGAVTAMMVFISVLVHELAHAFFARRSGINIHNITLYIFGGLAHLEREPDSPAAEFKVAAAGPAASFSLSFLFYLLAELLVRTTSFTSLPKALLHLGAVNLLIACFNLLPGFPLDGGRVLRAILWWRGKDYLSATRASLQSGATIAVSLIIVGVITLALHEDLLNGVWSILAGLLLVRLLYSSGPELLRAIKARQPAGARTAAAAPAAAAGQPKITVREAMTKDITAAQPDQAVALLRKKMAAHSTLLVVQDRRLHGILRSADISKLTEAEQQRVFVREVMQPVMADHFLTSDLALEEARARLTTNGLGQAAVLDRDGFVIGYVSLQDLERHQAARK